MDIKGLLKDSYRDDMTATELMEALSTVDVIDTDTYSRTKKRLDEVTSELGKLTKENRSLKSDKMSDEEKLNEAIRSAEDSKREYNRKLNQLEVEKILISSGLTKEDYSDLIEGLVTDDGEASVARANAVVNLLSMKIKAADKAARKEIMQDVDVPSSAGAQKIPRITRKEFIGMTLAERSKLAANDPETYKALVNQK